jgi:hypothetical protein
MVVALGLAMPLAVSGIIEAFVTPSTLPPWSKLALGAIAWCLFMGYLVVVGGRAARAGLHADVDVHEREALAPTV